jgi:hypothetical protein
LGFQPGAHSPPAVGNWVEEDCFVHQAVGVGYIVPPEFGQGLAQTALRQGVIVVVETKMSPYESSSVWCRSALL